MSKTPTPASDPLAVTGATVSDVEKLLDVLLFTPGLDSGTGEVTWGLPFVLWGPPGGGKTTRIRRHSRRRGLPAEVLSPGERGEGEFGVTPVPSEDRKWITHPAPEWARTFATKGGAGVVFLDELSTASPLVQPALLGLLQEGRIGGTYLGPRVRRGAASNSTEDSAGGWDLPKPIANRLLHFAYPAPTGIEWAAHMRGRMTGTSADEGSTFDAAAEETRVLAAWPAAYATAVGLVTSFLEKRPSLLHVVPATGDPAASRAWPSPRSWEMATRVLAGAMIHGLSESDTDACVEAAVGIGAATEFRTYRKEADLPDIAKLLDGAEPFAHDPHRLDRTLATLAACAALVLGTPTAKLQDARGARCWGILKDVSADAEDVVVPSAKTLIDGKVFARPSMLASARVVLERIQAVLPPGYAKLIAGGK